MYKIKSKKTNYEKPQKINIRQSDLIYFVFFNQCFKNHLNQINIGIYKSFAF